MGEYVTEPTVEMYQVLDKDGNVNEKRMPKLTDAEIKRMYELMILSRVFDDIALRLQREGRLLTYASHRGQEAAQIGVALAMDKEDWLFPAFRENAAFIARGYPMEMLFQYWGGDERGMKIPEGMNFFTVAIPVSTQIPHAVGFAWAAKMKKEKYSTVVFFGDGATSKGDFHEGLNFAGVFKLPIVFICQNNQWAISVPRSRQSASKTLAQKAVSYGFPGLQIDGNDVFAIYKEVKEALERCKKGVPTLIECFTYRIESHTTADDATKYRDPKEVEYWKQRDPIDRLRKYMQKKRLWNEDYEKKVLEDAKGKVEVAVKKAESVTAQSPEEIFKYTYSDIPWNLKEQMNESMKSE